MENIFNINMGPNISDLPCDILLRIFELVSGDIKKNPFLRYNKKNGKVCPRKDYSQRFWSNQLRKYIDITFEDHDFESRVQPMVLPNTISTLCLVSRDFNRISNNLWEPFYVENLRKGNPYKRKYFPSFYREKVYKIIKDYYENVLKTIETPMDHIKTMEIIKNNNASVYLKSLQNVVNDDDIDNEHKYHKVGGLLKYRPPNDDEYNMQYVCLTMKIEHMIDYRRKAIKEANAYSEMYNAKKKEYDSKKKIVDLL